MRVNGGDDLALLIARLADGDRQALDALYSRTAAKLFGIQLRVLRDRGRAEDALQDAYIKIWQNAHRYDPAGARAMTWLITIARNAAIDVARRRVERTGGDEVARGLPCQAATPEAATIAADEARRLIDCLEELGAEPREAVRGAYLEGKTYAALAEAQDVPINTMRSRLRRALIQLRACMSG